MVVQIYVFYKETKSNFTWKGDC